MAKQKRRIKGFTKKGAAIIFVAGCVLGGVACAAGLLTARALTERTALEVEIVQAVETEPLALSSTADIAVPSVAYGLSAEDRDLVERVVMAEAGGECFEGQEAVAQCILNACVNKDLGPGAVVQRFGYTSARPDASDSVKSAVAAVFDNGDTIIDPDTMYFYAPASCSSAWHESLTYVCTIGNHKFFKEVN